MHIAHDASFGTSRDNPHKHLSIIFYYIQKKAMMQEVNGQRKRGRPKITWKRQVEKRVKKVGLNIEEAADRRKRREGVRAIAEG